MDKNLGVIRRSDDDLIFYCRCLDATHFVWFSFCDFLSNDKEKHWYNLDVMPNFDYTRGFWGRAWIAIKYAFNPKSYYYPYSCAFNGKGEIEALRDFFNECLEKMEANDG